MCYFPFVIPQLGMPVGDFVKEIKFITKIKNRSKRTVSWDSFTIEICVIELFSPMQQHCHWRTIDWLSQTVWVTCSMWVWVLLYGRKRCYVLSLGTYSPPMAHLTSINHQLSRVLRQLWKPDSFSVWDFVILSPSITTWSRFITILAYLESVYCFM